MHFLSFPRYEKHVKHFFCTFQSEITTYGRIRGLILRDQLIVILEKKIFNETSDDWDRISSSMFRDEYPRYPTIEVSYYKKKFKNIWHF